MVSFEEPNCISVIINFVSKPSPNRCENSFIHSSFFLVFICLNVEYVTRDP